MSLARQILLDAPGTYFPLDEPSGSTCANLATPADVGTLTGAATLGRAPIRPGSKGCLDLTGSGAGMTFSSPVDMSLDWTIELWATWENITTLNPLLSKYPGGGGGSPPWAFLAYSEPSQSYGVNCQRRTGGEYRGMETGFIPVVGKIYQVVFRTISDTLTIGLNGIMRAVTGSPMWTNASANNGGVWALGHNADGFWGDPAHGASDLAIFQGGLSNDRIKAHYQAGIREPVVV